MHCIVSNISGMQNDNCVCVASNSTMAGSIWMPILAMVLLVLGLAAIIALFVGEEHYRYIDTPITGAIGNLFLVGLGCMFGIGSAVIASEILQLPDYHGSIICGRVFLSLFTIANVLGEALLFYACI